MEELVPSCFLDENVLVGRDLIPICFPEENVLFGNPRCLGDMAGHAPTQIIFDWDYSVEELQK